MTNTYVSCTKCGGLFDCSHEKNLIKKDKDSNYNYDGKREYLVYYIIYEYKCPYCKKKDKRTFEEETFEGED